MRYRWARLVMSVFVLAAPAWALGRCPTGGAVGIETNCCCTSGCACPMTPLPRAGSALGECQGSQPVAATDLAAVQIQRGTHVEQATSAVCFLASGPDATSSGYACRVHRASASSLPPCSHCAFELFCTFLL